jgi:hypothetical protein
MSTFYTSFSVANLGRRACSVAGVPQLLALGIDGLALGGPAHPGRLPMEGKAGAVRIAAGGDAEFRASWPEDAFAAGQCRPRDVARYRVVLPGSRRAHLVPYPGLGRCTSAAAMRSFRVGRLEPAAPSGDRAPPPAPRLLPARRGEHLPRCPAAKLVISLDPESAGGAGAGTSYTRLAVTNLSGRACESSGVPTVVAVDSAGRAIGPPARRSPAMVGVAADGRYVGSARIGRHGTAYIVLAIADPGNYGPSECGYETAAGLRITLPHASASQILPMPLRRCPHRMRGGSQLSVGRIE